MNSRRPSPHPWPQRRGEGHLGVRLAKRRQEEVEQHHQLWEAFSGTPQFEDQFTTDLRKFLMKAKSRRERDEVDPRPERDEMGPGIAAVSLAIAVVVVVAA